MVVLRIQSSLFFIFVNVRILASFIFILCSFTAADASLIHYATYNYMGQDMSFSVYT